MTTNSNLILVSLDSMVMWNKDNELMFVLDELQSVSIQNNEETTDITGKNGRKLASLKQSKTVAISGSNGVLSAGMLSAQTGGEYLSSDSYPVSWYDILHVDDPDNVRTNYKAVGFEGSEIRTIVRESLGGTIDTINQIKQGATPATGVFTYDPTTKLITFAEDEVAVGDIIRVYYTRNVPATHVSNPADKFSAEGMVVFDCTARDVCNNYYRSQLVIPRAEFTGNFTLDIGTEQAVHNFEINALASVSQCDVNTSHQENIYWNFITFDKDTEDAA